jgi:hypothetical protein
MDLSTGLAMVSCVSLYLVGLSVAWGTRQAPAGKVAWAVLAAFIVMLLTLGIITLMGFQQQVGLWIPSAFTMMVMILTAVVDLGSPTGPSTFS